jgi:hypothetical protein
LVARPCCVLQSVSLFILYIFTNKNSKLFLCGWAKLLVCTSIVNCYTTHNPSAQQTVVT